MRESNRVTSAKERYENAKSDEGLPGPPGIEYEGIPDEMSGSGYEKGVGPRKGEFIPPEEQNRQPSVAEAAAERLDVWDPETETIDPDMAHAVIMDIEDPEKRKAALEALAEYEETQLQKDDYEEEIIPGETTQKEVIQAVSASPAAKTFGAKPRPGRKKARLSPYERQMQKFVVGDPDSLQNWFKEKGKNPDSRRWLFMNADSWEKLDKIEEALEAMRSEINSMGNHWERVTKRRLWVKAADKLEHNRIALRKKGIRDTRRKDKKPEKRAAQKPENRRELKPVKGKIWIDNEADLGKWVARQRRILDSGEKDEAKLVFKTSSEDGLRNLRDVVEEMSKRVEEIPDDDPKRETEKKILKLVKAAYRSARWFVRSRDTKDAKPAPTTKDKKRKWQQRGQKITAKKKPKQKPREGREASA